MNKSDTIKELATALSKFQSETVDAIKDKKGDKGSYADLGQILNLVRPLMSKHGLSVAQLPCESTIDGNIAVDTMLMHESGEWISNSFSMPINRIIRKSDGRDVTNAPQASGSVITYARRYALTAVLGITQEDNDAQAHREEQKNVDQVTEKNDIIAAEFNRKLNDCKEFEGLKNVFAIAYEWAKDNGAVKQGNAIRQTYNDIKTLEGWA